MNKFRTTAVRGASMALLICLSAVLMCGCLFSGTSSGSSKKKKALTDYYGESTVVAARYYSQGEDVYYYEELPEDQLPALVEKLDSMEYKYHFFHTDYFWGGQMGIELDLEDGNHITYDGTKIELRSESRVIDGDDPDNDLKSDFLEITNCSFWEEMAPFFPSINPTAVFSTW